VKWLASVLLVFALTACGQRSAPAPSASTTDEVEAPPPAPTEISTETPQPTATLVPTNTAVPTATRVPDTPTPVPTSTPTPRPTATPQPVYSPNPYERLSALRSYHFQFSVNADPFDYSVAGDEATPNYHVTMAAPLSPPLELYFVNGRYVWNAAGAGFIDSGTTPPVQAAPLEAAEAFARNWFDHPDSAVFKATETANGVRAHHFALTWKAGRQVAFGAISTTTYDPTTGDVWLDAASGALVKAKFSMRVSVGGEVSTIVTNVDVTNINRPVSITPPAAQKAASA
jgi:predicted small lipoprotein YifL